MQMPSPVVGLTNPAQVQTALTRFDGIDIVMKSGDLATVVADELRPCS